MLHEQEHRAAVVRKGDHPDTPLGEAVRQVLTGRGLSSEDEHGCLVHGYGDAAGAAGNGAGIHDQVNRRQPAGNLTSAAER